MFDPGLLWVFEGSAPGWAVPAGTATLTFAPLSDPDLSGAMHWHADTFQSQIFSPAFDPLPGGVYTTVYIRLRTATSTWQGEVYWYDDLGHGPSEASVGRLANSLEDTDGWQTWAIDMVALTADRAETYSRWGESNITRIRIDGPNAGDSVDIAWIAIGRPGTPPTRAQVLDTTLAGGNVVIKSVVLTDTTPTSDAAKDGTWYLVY